MAKADDAAAAEQAADKLATRGTVMMDPKRFGEARYEAQNWLATVPKGTSRQDILTDVFFVKMAHKITDGAMIEVRAEDMSFWTLLLVVSVDARSGRVETRELIWKDLEPCRDQQYMGTHFRIMFAGLTDRWMIIRRSDGMVVQKGLHTPEAAIAMMASDYRDQVIQ